MQSIKIGASIPLGHLHQTPVRVIKILDSSKSVVAGFSAFRTDRLEEWWLTPHDRFSWGESDIAQTGCRDLNQLVRKLTRDEDGRTWLRKVQTHICQASPPHRSVSDFGWRLSTRLIDDVGSVLAVVCGTKDALEALATGRATAHASSW